MYGADLAAAFARSDARIAVLEEMPVGGSLAAGLVALRAAPVDARSSVRVHALWGKVIAWATAQQMIATNSCIYGVRECYPDVIGEEHILAANEIAAATAIPFGTAIAHIELVERIDECMPASWEALDRGEISLGHLRTMHRVTRDCSPAVVQRVETKLIPIAVARGWTPSELARAVRKEIIAIDPEGAADRAEKAKAKADVEFLPGENDTATIAAHGDAEQVRHMMDLLDERAAAMGRAGDDRPIGVRRFAALFAAVTGAGDGSVPGTLRALVLVKVDLTTLLGLNDNPAELCGYGPITAETARRIAADATLRRLVTDPLTGSVVDLGRKYRPSKLLRDLVRVTQPRCAMVGCSRPAYQCEIDHRLEHNRGGDTNQDNLQPLCKLHHQLKTKKQWKVGVNADGSLTWTSFLGFTYTSRKQDPLTGDPDPPESAAA
ncbi:MAG TPA: DUF222 domain-containing protein [Mycobacteriales bacterium]|nr:DUF222 domain-containing protein [Mycobacteriales bacterium]